MRQSGFYRFLLIAGILYAALFFVYEYLVKSHTTWDQAFISYLSRTANSLLTSLNYRTFPMREDGILHGVGIDGSHGVWIGSGCNALTLFGLFAVFIFAWPGKIKHKLWFIPTGILIIHCLNLLRIVALAIIAYQYPAYLDFNHTYTFTFIIYSCIFGLWMLWVNRYGKTAA